MHPPVDVVSVRVLGGTTVELVFNDDAVRTRDLGPLLWGPVFAPMRDNPDVFAEVVVDPESGTIAWPNGADIDPELLRYDDLWAAGPATMSEADAIRADNLIRTSSTPPPEVLAGYRGEWVAMADNVIVDHDPSLTALVNRLNAAGAVNDRLFRVPDDPTEPAPWTLG